VFPAAHFFREMPLGGQRIGVYLLAEAATRAER
jgi:hypothetical protein